MKRNAWLVAIAAVLMLTVGFGGYAYSADNTAANKNCASQCAKFVDNNQDGKCDNAAQCQKDGKPACNGKAANCPIMKNGQKCDQTGKTSPAQKSGNACSGKASNSCKSSCKAICGK